MKNGPNDFGPFFICVICTTRVRDYPARSLPRLVSVPIGAYASDKLTNKLNNVVI